MFQKSSIRIVASLVGASLASVVAFASSLPTGYTQLAFLESTGTQYIDTGVVFGKTNGFSITYQVTSAENNQRFCGSIGGGTDARCCIGANRSGNNSTAYVGWNTLVVPSTIGVHDM